MVKRFDTVAPISFVSFFSSLYFYIPVLTIYYQSKGLNFTAINSLTGILIGTIFLAELPTGVIADRIGRKPSIILSLFLQLLGEIIFLFARDYSYFIASSVLAGLGFAFRSGCWQALVYDSLKEVKNEGAMQRVAGRINAFSQGGQVLGALVSSLVITRLSSERIQMAILLTIASVGIALFLSFLLRESKQYQKDIHPNPSELLRKTIALMRTNASLRRIILLGIFSTPFVHFLLALEPPYLLGAGVPPALLGFALAAGGVLALWASKNAYQLEKRFGVDRAVLIATLTPPMLYVLMGFFVHPVLAVFLFITNYGSMSLQDPLFADYYNRHIASPIRATALSAINMFSSLYIALIGLAIGRVADISVSAAFLVMAGIIIVGTLLFRINKTHVSL